MTIFSDKQTVTVPTVLYDRLLLVVVFSIVAIGLTMVASASVVNSESVYHWPFHFLLHQFIHFVIGIVLSIIVLRTPVARLQELTTVFLIASFVLLVLVLIPGIGRHVNGSARWVGVGPLGLQVSEFAKFAVVVYLAGYLVRHYEEVTTHVSGFIKPMGILSVMAGLLLLEPDFGATVVIMATALGMMFLAGVRLRQFAVLLAIVIIGLAFLAISSPYRLARLTTFLNPWANQFDSGYQLTQSLIAFGRGGWLGVGLGNSVQKLFYLPEAHTDFLFAVIAEELGFVGALTVIGLYITLFFRSLWIGRRAQTLEAHFAGYLAYGIALWLGFQFIVNVGVNAGVLPTKGLTLPLMSYGGSSILINCIAIACLLRIDYELRLKTLGVHHEDELKLGQSHD
jgi:cell division protein FtsW